MLLSPELIDVSVIRKVLILAVSAYPANEEVIHAIGQALQALGGQYGLIQVSQKH